MPPAEPPSAIHLRPAAPLAERVLLPGDPHRALAVAQDLLEKPRMFNHHRGLWGYTGPAPDGELLTVQATGMGGPSAAIVVEELIDLGARTLVRIGTCGAIDPGLELGDLLTATEVVADDGASAALGAERRLRPDASLTRALRAAAGGRHGAVASTDLFYDRRAGRAADWRRAGALAVEMEAATILRVAELRGARAACLLAVSDVLAPPPSDGGAATSSVRLAPDEIERAGLRLGQAAFAALRRAGDPPPSGRPRPERPRAGPAPDEPETATARRGPR